MRRAAKRDQNEPAIIDALERTGWVVHRLSDPGIADLLCYQPRTMRFALVEVKAKRGKLTPQQQTFATKVPVMIVRNIEEAIALGRC